MAPCTITTGQSVVTDALLATQGTDANGVQLIANDEIQIVEMTDGSYLVILPGITDLSTGGIITEPLGFGGSGNTVRKGKHQAPEAIYGGSNLYAQRVKEALEMAGVPRGANVSFVGHSAGSYTALSLAGDPSFNSDGRTGGYQVRVRNVYGFAASNEWQGPKVPASTNVLLVNSRQDVVVRAEDVFNPPYDARRTTNRNAWDPETTLIENRPNQVAVRINAGNQRTLEDGFFSGHHPKNYAGAIPHIGEVGSGQFRALDGLSVKRRFNMKVLEQPSVVPQQPIVR
jgi:hypothetical protein